MGDRELRDRLEQAQSELRQARARLDELEAAARDRDVLSAQLELLQEELDEMTERLDALGEEDVEALREALSAAQRERGLLHQRLELADKTREQWDGRLAQREAELAVLRREHGQLKQQLAARSPPRVEPTERLGHPAWRSALALAAAGVIAATLWFARCG